ncbi:protein BCAP [Pezoporus flaviventris]|uniref:protein BCAP n=1 Tax=Pezoporus flaviventris TaxID=889875 RepID=UPI002AB215EA|nr:protein BCAP [Pezoporus flaviventris]
MSSSLPSSSYLPVRNCTAPLRDLDLLGKLLLRAAEGKMDVPPREAGKLCSLIQPYEKDYHRTTQAIQDGKYFTDLSKESDSIEQLNSKNMDTSMQKLNEIMFQNTILRRKTLEREKQVKDLTSRLQLKKANVQKGDHLSRSAKTIQLHLQHQIQRKEAENDELKEKIQTLQKKITAWKLHFGEYKHQMLALKETSEQKKSALKKAVRCQKQRAQHFEAAVEKLTSKIKEREVKLSEILSASSVWKKQHDRVVEGNTRLEIQTEDLKKQITRLLEDLKRKEEWRRNSDEEILGKLNAVDSENEKIYLENEKLKASLATLESNSVSVENELQNLQKKAKVQENLVEQYKNQVQELQTAVEELKSRYATALNENKRIIEDESLEVDQVRDNVEPELKELEHGFELLKAPEEKQQSSQKKLLSWERIHAQKCKTLRELQVQEEYSATSAGSHSLEEENCNIEKKYEDLKRQLEKMEIENKELASQLKNEDESLQCSQLQLEEKIAEYNGLTRQLESALEEGRKMVAEELEKMSCREQALQTKMLFLEAEVREGQERKNQLHCIFHHVSK